MKPKIFQGRVFCIRDAAQNPIHDIDTDQIFHNAHLAITDILKMAPYAFGNLKGFSDFPQKVKPGDILVVGKNFGSGSSRQQAVDCFIALGIAAILGESFGAIYKRNAINSGLPIISLPGLLSLKAAEGFLLRDGDLVELDLPRSQVNILLYQKVLKANPRVSPVQIDIYEAGTLFQL